MKKRSCLMLVVLLLLQLCMGCVEKENGYKLIKENGEYNIVLRMEDDSFGFIDKPYLYYDSMEEMIGDLKNGDYTEGEMVLLARHPRTEEGKIKAPNLEKLIEPIVPNEAGDCKVAHFGREYHFQYNNPENAENLLVYISTQESHNIRIEKFLHYEEKYADEEFFAVRQDPDRNATEYSWKSRTGENIKHILYTISKNETVYYVREEYIASAGVLEYVYIWYAYEGMYAYIRVYLPAQRPSEEWITSFGIKPYEP